MAPVRKTPRIAKKIPRKGKPAPDPDADLAQRYPDWFALGVVAVPAGWTALVDTLFEDLAAQLGKADRKALQIAAVRERAGQLTVETYKAVPAAQKLIEAAGAASIRVCQSCGAAARRREFSGWSATLCTRCRKQWSAMRIG